jgi:phosphomannomutase
VRVGMVPTPALYFAVKHAKADGGIMVTGSHNPKEYNGFKCMDAVLALHGDRILNLYARILAQSGTTEEEGGTLLPPEDISPAYLERVLSVALSDAARQGGKTLKAAWDPGNGAAGDVVQALVRRLPGEHVVINGAPDGNFPAHHPDPSVPENLRQLRETVLAEGCDVGFAFDGDGDRLGVVTRTGEIVNGDRVAYLFATDYLAKRPGARIVLDVKTGDALFRAVREAGGDAVMWKTGHSLVKEKMHELGAVFGGEASGHLFFSDHDGFDDGIFAAVRLMDVILRAGRPLEELASALPQGFRTPEWRLDVGEEEKTLLVDALSVRLKKDGVPFCDIDGVRVETDDGWWIARVSNTQPAVVIMAESGSAAGLARLVERIDSLCTDGGFNLLLRERVAI